MSGKPKYKKVVEEVAELIRSHQEVAEVRILPFELGKYGEYVRLYDADGKVIKTILFLTDYKWGGRGNGLYTRTFLKFFYSIKAELEKFGFQETDYFVFKKE